MGTYCTGGTCSSATGHDLSGLLVTANSSLTEDNDDDGDGIPDASDPYPLDTDNDGINNASDPDADNDGVLNYLDPEPFNAANSSWPLDSTHRGSAIHEQNRMQ